MAKRDESVAVQQAEDFSQATSSAETLVCTFNAIRDELISTLLFVLGNKDDAHDAAQDAFVKCWAHRDRLDQVVDLRAWIFRVCFNSAKYLQRSAWKRRSKPLRGEQYTMMTSEPTPGQVLEHKESVERLREAIHHLREEEKEVFLLRQNGNLTYEQIAQVRECPVGTVKTQMRSALDKLRKLLN